MKLFQKSIHDDDWFDASFQIDSSAAENGGVRHQISARERLRRVRVVVWLKESMVPLAWDDGDPVFTAYREGVVIRSLGKESDRFVQALAHVYGCGTRDLKMCSQVPATAIVLESDIQNRPFKVKLFFNDLEESDPDLYAE